MSKKSLGGNSQYNDTQGQGQQTQQSKQDMMIASNLTGMMNPGQYSSNQISMTQLSNGHNQDRVDASLEKYIMDMNEQMQYLNASNEMSRQQNEHVMRQQQQRIIQLQQMCESMRSDMDNMRQGKQQLWEKDQHLQQGLSHLDMLNDFEMLSKNTPYANKHSYLNRVRQNPLMGGDSLNQFIEQYGQGNAPQQRSLPPSQQSQMRQYNQDPRFNMGSNMNNNHFKSAASLSLNQQPYDQYMQQDLHAQNNMPPVQQYQFNPNQFQQQEIMQRENKFNPILQKIEQQNEMLMKLIDEMDKPQQPQQQNNKKSRKKKYDDSDDSDTQNDDEYNPQLIEQRELESKIQYLENSIKQQKMQNQYMVENNIMNPDVNYLLNAANQKNSDSLMSSKPQYFSNSIYNKPQYGATNMPGATFTQNQPQQQNFQSVPSPDQFLQQVQMNNQKFQMQPPFMSGGMGAQNGQNRPSFLNDNKQVPHPDMLQQIFQQQLLNSQRKN